MDPFFFWFAAFESNTCSMKNFCSSNPCQNNGVCSTSFNDFVCSCPTGYTGKLCQHDINACETNPCLSGGTCVDKPGNQGFECVCAAGYTGNHHSSAQLIEHFLTAKLNFRNSQVLHFHDLYVRFDSNIFSNNIFNFFTLRLGLLLK